MRLPGIVVSGGKGGVGKSTVAAAVAMALATRGVRVGLVDADLSGPSQGLLFGIEGSKMSGGRLVPILSHGVAVVSIGAFVEEDAPLLWNALTIRGALRQLILEPIWQDVEVLVLDMPPGTHDVHLHIHDYLQRAAMLFVSTNSILSVADCRRSIAMAARKGVHVLGVIENMSQVTCSHCDSSFSLFTPNALSDLAFAEGIPLLGRLPWTDELVTGAQVAQAVDACAEWMTRR